MDKNMHPVRRKAQKGGPLRDVYALLHDLVYILAGITLFFVFVLRLVGVSGPSMRQTLQDGDYVALLSNFLMGDLEQGDIIVARKQSFDNGIHLLLGIVEIQAEADIAAAHGAVNVVALQNPDDLIVLFLGVVDADNTGPEFRVSGLHHMQRKVRQLPAQIPLQLQDVGLDVIQAQLQQQLHAFVYRQNAVVA